VENADAASAGGRFAGRQLGRICLVVLVVLIVLGSGAALMSSGSVGPSMRTEAASYQPGDQVGVQLRNGLRPAGYNLCFAFVSLQGHDVDGWVTVAADLGPSTGDLIACTAELRPLPPLGGAHATVHLPPELPSGAYRLVYELEISGDRRAVTTDPFTVGVRG
jgi:methionine-rich copper-binding protein CopC